MEEKRSGLQLVDGLWIAALAALVWHHADFGGSINPLVPDVKETRLTKALGMDPVKVGKAKACITKYAQLLREDGMRTKPFAKSLAAAQMRIKNMGDCIAGVHNNWEVEHPDFDDAIAALCQDVTDGEGWRERLASRLDQIAEREL